MLKILGLPIRIEWDKFLPGTSFFIPCLDRKAVEEFVMNESYRRRHRIICKQVVEKGVYGLRCWRVE